MPGAEWKTVCLGVKGADEIRKARFILRQTVPLIQESQETRPRWPTEREAEAVRVPPQAPSYTLSQAEADLLNKKLEFSSAHLGL